MTTFLLESDAREIVNGLPISMLARFAGKVVLITGGRGFLGRYFTEVFRWLNRQPSMVSNPVRVILADNLISAGPAGAEAVDDANITFHKLDVVDERSWLSLPAADFILHAAGIASPAHYRRYPLETLDVATIGLRRALEHARKSGPDCRMAFFSSSEIYGDPTAGNVPTPESYKGHVAPIGPRACYDNSKRLGETLAEIYAQQHGVHCSIIRPFNVYGPGMQRGDYRVLPNFASQWVDGKPVEVYGDGKQTRTYCYVTDAIGGFLRVLVDGRAGEPYNIGNPRPEVSVLELVKIIQSSVLCRPGDLNEQFPYVVKDHPATYPADEPQRRCPDISKAQHELGYMPRVQLIEGLKRFFGWAERAYGPRVVPIVDPVSIHNPNFNYDLAP